MAQVLQEAKAGRLTLQQAAQQFGAPKSSLSDRGSGRVSSDCVPGQRTLLTPEDEDSLVEYCLDSFSWVSTDDASGPGPRSGLL